ncbi:MULTISPECIES: sulfatase family protein [unclassified Paenibacillus]|uniref:sulfatase family protein n=1 Tax=unclassified Paenibacillus TaxID=185978 RepID=UPI00364010A1
MTQQAKPNILWICADQLRGQALSCMGDPNVNTPNIDRLAAEGFQFTHALSGTPWCTPFRGSLMTGRYPHRSGVPANHYSLPMDAGTIARSFRDNHYRTCYIGKWHLDGDRPHLNLQLPENSERLRVIAPEHRGGFEDWWAYENNNRPFDCWVHTDSGSSGQTELFRLPGYETDSLTDLLIDWLKARAKPQQQPFFAVLSVQPPHNPYVAPEENMSRHHPSRIQFRANVPPVNRVRETAARELAGYYAAIERLDWNVGRIRRVLQKTGLADDTYIMFFSDHGDMHGSHGLFRKSSPWEEAIRIPFIIGGPSRDHQTRKMFDFPLNHVDIAPTTLGLCGIGKPEWMDGFDYSPWVLQKRPQLEAPDSAYMNICIPSTVSYAVDRPYRGIVTRDGWKYCVLEGQPWLLFNLQEDPYELVNLAYVKAFHSERNRLQEQLKEWIVRTRDSFVLP